MVTESRTETRSRRRIRRDIETVIAAQRARLMRREASMVNDMEIMYNKALDAIEASALKIASSTTLSSQIMRAQLLSLVDDVTAQLLVLDAKAVDMIGLEQRFAILQSGADMDGILRAMGLNSRLNVASATRAMAGVHGDNSPLLRLLVRKSVDAGAKAREVLVVGTIKGDNPRVVATELRKALVGPKYSAERIARTEVLRNYRGAMRERMAESGVAIGWIWISARDTTTCAFCWAQHGTKHNLNESMATHPNCRCSEAPQLGRGIDITSDGPTSFDRLNAGKQRAILGNSKYEAYKNNEFALRDLVGFRQHPDWGNVGYEKSLAELRR